MYICKWLLILWRLRGSSLHCEVTKLTNSSTMTQFWDWVKVAKYTGTVVVNGKTLDQWQFTVSWHEKTGLSYSGV